MVAIAGLDPIRFLHARDPVEFLLTQMIAERVIEIRKVIDRNRAVMIAQEVGKLFK